MGGIKAQIRAIVREMATWPYIGRPLKICTAIVSLPELRAQAEQVPALSHMVSSLSQRQYVFEHELLPGLLQSVSELNHRLLATRQELNELVVSMPAELRTLAHGAPEIPGRPSQPDDISAARSEGGAIAGKAMKIAYVNAHCARHDAISDAVLNEMSWLRGAGHTTRLFGYACDYDDIPFTRVEKEADVAFDPYFQSCDQVVFHFGVFSPLFNLLMIVPRGASRTVVFHNVTPRQLLSSSAHDLIDRSFAQMANMAFADVVICDSEVNRAALRRTGIDVPACVLPLAVHGQLQAPARKPSFDDHVLRLTFVGRLVASKGPLDLLEAVDRMAAEGRTPVRVDIVANLHFSDEEVVASVRARMHRLEQDYGARLSVLLHANATDSEKQRILAEADIFALPTYHEGFCVPILEAFASGCRVVTYDNSNTPFITAGMGTLVRTGDVTGLAQALANEHADVASAGWQSTGYADHVRVTARYIDGFKPETVGRRFVQLLEGVTRRRALTTARNGHGDPAR